MTAYRDDGTELSVYAGLSAAIPLGEEGHDSNLFMK